MAHSLAERLNAHGPQKARLAEQEVKLRIAERKAREALYGALLSWRNGTSEKERVSGWTALGGLAFARETRMRDEGKEAIVLTFPAPLNRGATIALLTAGFRFSRVMQHWEGLTRFDEAAKLADAHGGTARRVILADVQQRTPAAVAAE